MHTHVVVGLKLYKIKKSVFDKLYEKYKKDMDALEHSEYIQRDTIHNDYLNSLVKSSILELKIENVYDFV